MIRAKNAVTALGCSVLVVSMFLTGAWAQEGYAVPDQIKAPSVERLVLRGHASGDQIYTCQASPGNDSPSNDAHFVWILSAPDAKLSDDAGKQIATHFAGPTWKSTDGSQVKGKVVGQSSPDPGSIPWLLLSATDHNGAGGILSNVLSIQRLNTRGGKAPVTGCDAQHPGATARIHYTADYNFYAAPQ